MQKRSSVWNRWIVETVSVSAAYLLASSLTLYFIYPIQLKLVPEFPSFASLLYLPHGVRVLAAWLLGWRSIIAMMPGAFIAQYYWVYTRDVDILFFGILGIGLLVAPIAFGLFRKFGLDAEAQVGRAPRWQWVMGVGVLASLLNSSMTNLVLGTTGINNLAFLIGDVFGLFFLVLILILFFRQLRARGY